MRVALMALVLACSSPPAPTKPTPPPDDTAVRIRVAYAEARRGGGIAELVDLATHGAKHERVLALRGLGRIGGATAIEMLRTALGDPDRDVIAAAAAAIGLAASLDDEDFKVTAALLAHADQPAVIEALGRAGDASAQPTLAKLCATRPEAALALGRHGRRKIALFADARTALIAALDSKSKYEATYALGREHIEKQDFDQLAPHLAVTAVALAKLLDDANPEVRAQAIAGIAKHKQVAAHAQAIEAKLIDPDWRVAVEAVRALSADEYRNAVVTAAVRTGPDRAHVTSEVLRSLIGKSVSHPGIKQAAVNIDERAVELWMWLVGASNNHVDEALRWAKDHPRRHLALGLIADWLKTKAPIDQRRTALAALLADADVRVRAAAMGTLATMYKDGDQRDREAIVNTVVAAIASRDPILSGSAIEAADELYEHDATHGALQAALVLRADYEKDVELATALYGVIGKRAIGSGAAACKQGLDGHPVLAKAAAECLKKLGEPAPTLVNPRDGQPPFVDITQVIGKRVTWNVRTSKGDVAIVLRPDVAPWAVATIVTLTKRGYYDGLELHRVVPNFVVQGGDPTESGWGGPGFMIPAEPGSLLDGPGYVAGGVGIADAGRDSGGSQWFVMHSRAPHLDGRYTWVGNLISGGNSADALLIGDEIVKATVAIE